MGLCSASFVAATLADLDAAGMAIVYHDEKWFITFLHHEEEVYTTLELALEASVHYLAEGQARQVGGHDTPHLSRP